MSNEQRIHAIAASTIAALAHQSGESVAEYAAAGDTFKFLAPGAYRHDETLECEINITPALVAAAEAECERAEVSARA